MAIAGLGPHGERAAPPERLELSDADAARAREKQFTAAVVFHTTTSDWSTQALAGIVTTLGRYSAAVVEVVDCQFSIENQTRALERIVGERPDAIISIPIGNTAVADAHRNVSRAGIKLVVMDNGPTGLLPGTDYASVISADNFGLGKVGAELLAPFIPPRGTAVVLGYGVDFFASNEREIAFRQWMAANRPDITVKTVKFSEVDRVSPVVEKLIDAEPDLDGMFAVWDVPAMQAIATLRARNRSLPITTIDLGNEAATELAAGGMIKGIGAQRPFDLGAAVATATVAALLDHQPPPWVALPALAVTRKNVIEAYQVVWHAPAPPALIKAGRGGATRR
ncbi:MAG: substrate-binding domain-containing protein [Bauldia sp.]|nr:substrate-binding domain-containing protein [Bauldia sp.]